MNSRLFQCMAIFMLVLLAAASAASQTFDAQLRDDWLVQARVRDRSQVGVVNTENDAAGACNGVKDGKWGFHTSDEESPWWQVDLGATQELDRVVLWNRCDDVAPRTDHLRLLLSTDGTTWTEAYAHSGPTFYGATDAKPLVVPLNGVAARFVRVQLPGKGFLHLDEVEVFGTADSVKNLALNQPANQSSISPWSADNRPQDVRWAEQIEKSLSISRTLAAELSAQGVDVADHADALAQFASAPAPADDDFEAQRARYFEARSLQRSVALASPLLDFDTLLFAKRVPGTYSHMSDQYYGWWSPAGRRPLSAPGISRRRASHQMHQQCVHGTRQLPSPHPIV